MKPGRFSFLGDDFENLFQYSDLFLPGIEKITGVFFSHPEHKLKIVSRNREEGEPDDLREILESRENLVMIQKFRSDSGNYSWIKRDDLPFEMPAKKIRTPNLFSEVENVILVLKFPNAYDTLSDLLFIHFNKNLGNFILSKSDKQLTAEHKSIIGFLLYHQFKSFLLMNHDNLRLLRTFNQGVVSIIRNNATLKEQLRQVQLNYGESMVSLARQYLGELSGNLSGTFEFTSEALEKIRNYQGNVRHMKTIIENAVIFMENLSMHDEQEVIQVQDYSLDFDSYQVTGETDQVTRKIDGRYSRAILLLDKLEKAAMSLKGRSMPLTSANVGKSMEPSITAPAITDALSKNKEMIRQLIAKYPEKWETIRRDFRPLQNVLRADLPDEAKEASA